MNNIFRHFSSASSFTVIHSLLSQRNFFSLHWPVSESSPSTYRFDECRCPRVEPSLQLISHHLSIYHHGLAFSSSPYIHITESYIVIYFAICIFSSFVFLQWISLYCLHYFLFTMAFIASHTYFSISLFLLLRLQLQVSI